MQRLLFLLSCSSAVFSCSNAQEAERPRILARRETVAGLPIPYDAKLPPLNPYLADSPWPMSHQGPYNQASSPFPGPATNDGLKSLLVEAEISIALLYTPIRDAESPSIWGSTFSDMILAEISQDTGAVVASTPKDRKTGELISGVYTLLDVDGTMFVPNGPAIDAYSQKSSPTGPEIQRLRTIDLADHGVRGDLVGINMTYDGWIAFASEDGQVGVVRRDFSAWKIVDLGVEEEISNSIAVDEDGGIYVVTSKSMTRVQWNGETLSLDEKAGAWRSTYEAGPAKPAPGRLGVGSGSTPTLMGIKGEDQFVVITDGQPLMHLVLFWRGKIPDDWKALGPDVPRRIAAQVPITFGDPELKTSVSEQSVLVYGNRAVVVNNDYGPDAGAGYAPVIGGAVSFGVEQFVWDATAKTMRTSWANPDVPCPNGIPTMSAPSQLMYCIGKRGDWWTVEALDWNTGAGVYSQPMGEGLTYNSVYASTEIGPDRNIITGTAGGFVDVRVRD